ncbi:hypothetical protein [Geminisphaera colitermitum]|uniref:hypothetical protein n=1 Tax=Geminisphaera colitermitum TaxID=1148786 RepID=UPI0005BD6812|nr:hypothetical protein [Geminisphaera colitermitum]
MKLNALLDLDTAGFTAPLAGAAKMLGGFAASMAALAGVSASIGGALAGMKQALDFGGMLTDLKAQTGIAIKDLVVMRQAFQDAGAGADAAAPAINLMQRAIAGISESGQPTKKIFAQLGLSIAALKDMGATEQFEAIAAKIRAIKNPAEQTNAAMEIFGRSGAAMLALIKNGGAMDAARTVVGSQADILEKNAAEFDRVSDALGATTTKVRGFFVGMTASLLPSITGAIDKLNGIDLAPIGEKFGAAISSAIDTIVGAFQNGTLMQIIGTSLTLGFKSAVNAFVGDFIGRFMAAKELLFSGDFWAGVLVGITSIGEALVKAFASAISFLEAGIIKATEEMTAAIGKIPGLGKYLGLNGAEARSFSDIFADTKKNGIGAAVSGFVDGAGNQAAEMTGFTPEKFGAAFSAAFAKYKEGFSMGKVFDTEGLSTELAALVQAAKEAAIAAREAGGNAPADKNTGAGNKGGATTTEQSIAPVLSDRLSKIGLFVGGAGGPAVDYQRRTASATEKTFSAVEKLVQKLPTGGGAVALYGA